MSVISLRTVPVLAFAFSSLAAVGCSSSSTTSTDTDAAQAGDMSTAKGDMTPAVEGTFSGGVMPLITEYGCFACHMTSTWDSGETLTDSAAIIAHLTGTMSTECPTLPYITPSDPDKSYMYQKVTGAGSCFTGGRMPLGGAMIDADDAANLKAWITAGAKND